MLKSIKRYSSKNLLILCSTFLVTLYIWKLRTPVRPCPVDAKPAGEVAVNPHLQPSQFAAQPPPPVILAPASPGIPVAPALSTEESFVLHARNYLSSSSGKVRLQQLVPFLVQISAPNPIYVVQVGANTGYELNATRHSKDDPTVAAVKHESARGILVEPVPKNFAQLTTNVLPYSERFKCLNVAVNTGNGAPSRMTFYTMNAARVRREWRSPLPWFLDQLGSFDINHLKKHFYLTKRYWTPKHTKGYYISRTVVNALPPRTIIDKLYERFPEANKEDGGDGISLLHVDAEGYDWKIMHAFLKTTLPKAIVFERKHLRPAEIRLSVKVMEKLGYAHWLYGQNTYAIYLGSSSSKVFGN